MTAHTPGPWHVQVRKEGWDIHEPISAGGFKIAHANTEPNARLIAAAPQLLEALKLLDEHLAAILDPEHCLHHVADSRNVMIDLRSTAIAAIAAAGE